MGPCCCCGAGGYQFMAIEVEFKAADVTFCGGCEGTK